MPERLLGIDDEQPSSTPLTSTLMELPLDNIFQMLKFVDPADIFAFGQVNYSAKSLCKFCEIKSKVSRICCAKVGVFSAYVVLMTFD